MAIVKILDCVEDFAKLFPQISQMEHAHLPQNIPKQIAFVPQIGRNPHDR